MLGSFPVRNRSCCLVSVSVSYRSAHPNFQEEKAKVTSRPAEQSDRIRSILHCTRRLTWVQITIFPAHTHPTHPLIPSRSIAHRLGTSSPSISTSFNLSSHPRSPWSMVIALIPGRSTHARQRPNSKPPANQPFCMIDCQSRNIHAGTLLYFYSPGMCVDR